MYLINRAPLALKMKNDGEKKEKTDSDISEEESDVSSDGGSEAEPVVDLQWEELMLLKNEVVSLYRSVRVEGMSK